MDGVLLVPPVAPLLEDNILVVLLKKWCHHFACIW